MGANTTAGSKADSLTRRGAPKDYPPEFGEAFETLRIVLGREDFEAKMEPLRKLIQNPITTGDKLALTRIAGATAEETRAFETILTYYEKKERDGTTLHQ